MMCYRLGAILVLLALTGCAGRTAAPVGSPEAQGCLIPQELEEIAAQFRNLRAIKGHFQDGDWNADVDAWMERKHQLMIQVGDRLGAGDCRQAQIVQLLDSPDLTSREGDDAFDAVTRLAGFEKPTAGPYELLIYYWRGSHDFLYFTAQGESVLSSGWWHAGD